MGSLRFSDYADSPTIFLPPQHYSFLPSSYSHFVQHHQPIKQVMQSEPVISPSNGPGGGGPPASARPSRKRSRDESSDDNAVVPEAKMPRPNLEPVQTEGMRVVIPPTGAKFSRDFQTGAWVQNQFVHTMQQSPASESSISSQDAEERRKIRRREREIAPSFSTTDGCDAIEQLTATTCEISEDPMVLQLGIGWRSISGDPDRRAAARGWAKFIERRYLIGAVRILAKHNSDCLLVGASDGVYVFTPDLKQGAFVAKDWSDVVKDIGGNSNFWFGGRELLHPVEASGFAQPSGMKNTDGQTVDSASAESNDYLPSTPSPAKYPVDPEVGDTQTDSNPDPDPDPDIVMVVD